MEILAAKRRTNIFGNQRICLFFHSDTENGLGAEHFYREYQFAHCNEKMSNQFTYKRVILNK